MFNEMPIEVTKAKKGLDVFDLAGVGQSRIVWIFLVSMARPDGERMKPNYLVV